MKSLTDHLGTMLSSEVRNYALPGLNSYLLENGKVRLFKSDRDTLHHITPHSHRFDFTCLVLSGSVQNIVMEPDENGSLYCPYSIQAVNGGLGSYTGVEEESLTRYTPLTTVYEEGDTYSMTWDQIHTIQFSKGAQVLFFEGPPKVETTIILEPYSNGRVIRTFKVEDWMFNRG